VAWSPDGTTLATGSDDSTVRLWDTRTGHITTFLSGHRGGVNSVAWSPDGATLASGGGDSTVVLWNARTRRTTATLTRHHSPVNSVAWSPDGTTLAIGSEDGTVRLWDTHTRRTAATLDVLPDSEYAAWNPDGTLRSVSPEAWQYLGWQVPGVDGGYVTRLPAEMFTELPVTGSQEPVRNQHELPVT
jgi:WD40 repeat protein